MDYFWYIGETSSGDAALINKLAFALEFRAMMDERDDGQFS